MPRRSDQILLVSGFLCFLSALIAINIFGSSTKAHSSMDYIHWSMLVASVLQIPFAVRLPQRGISLIASWLILLGLICIIGMCILDLVFWSIPDADLRRKVAEHLMETPTVWQPFMMWGTEELPCLGFILASFAYSEYSKSGSILVSIGAILSILGGGWYNVIGRTLITFGFVLNFNWLSIDVMRRRLQRQTPPSG